MAKTNHVIIAYFDNRDQAATVADEIKDWDKANDAIKLGGIGILTSSKKGKIKTQKVSRVSGGRGAKVGLALGAVAGILSGGVTLVGGAVGGAVVGAVGGKLLYKDLGLNDADRARLEQNLGGGQGRARRHGCRGRSRCDQGGTGDPGRQGGRLRGARGDDGRRRAGHRSPGGSG